MREIIFTNGRIVAGNEEFFGSVVMRDGLIAAVDQGASGVSGAVDLEGDYLIPGLIDVHSDSLERQFTPRFGVYWPSPLSAAVANDGMMHGCGVTTVLDSICAEAFPEEETRRRMFNDAIGAISAGEGAGLFRARHLLHLRCETADPKTPAILGEHLDNPLVRLVSLMDHTPGQRQFTDTDKYRKYYKKGWSDEEFAEISKRLLATQESCAEGNRARIVALSRERAIPLASHDDTLAEHVAQAVAEGIAIAEFPTTLTAARLARDAGIRIVMGGPNMVRGGSHSGNVSARDLAGEGLLDILSSDYVPGSLVAGAFTLHRLGMGLADAVAKISANPAEAVGLTDRGRVAPGLRADLVRVREIEGVPAVLRTWSVGCCGTLEMTEKNAA